jgi:hypothetical protein
MNKEDNGARQIYQESNGSRGARNGSVRENDKPVVHQVSDWCSGVAIKMGRRQGATKEHILGRTEKATVRLSPETPSRSRFAAGNQVTFLFSVAYSFSLRFDHMSARKQSDHGKVGYRAKKQE